MMEFFDMGNHTAYVWLAYGVSIVSIVGITISSIVNKKTSMKQVRSRVSRLKRHSA